ncbi:hypothetical protein KEM48_006546 [Puccinia striiformis f. sp. tritici PST-130]|nr:hypothetical protein KEM48_006546 [Puccinia striiformis f. sp. tritici PST-130]
MGWKPACLSLFHRRPGTHMKLAKLPAPCCHDQAHAMGKPSDVKPPMKRKVVPEPVRMPKPGNLLLPTWISKYAQSTYDSPGDGNCGFRCVAQALASEQPESVYVKQDGWFQVRTNLIQELHVNKAHWTGRLGGPSEIKRVIESLTVDPQATSVPSGKWMNSNSSSFFTPSLSHPFISSMHRSTSYHVHEVPSSQSSNTTVP